MKTVVLILTAVIFLTAFGAKAQWDVTILNPFEGSQEPNGLCAEVH